MELTKTILWIEDFDDKDSSQLIDDLDANAESGNASDRTSEISSVFPEKHQGRVNLEETVISALKAIDENCDVYDSIVLDINMTKGWPHTIDEQKVIKDKLSKAGVKIPEEIDDLKTNTGYYFYLYLLCKGFPKDRIIMRTAYNGDGVGNLTGAWNERFTQAGLNPPDSFGKSDDNEVFKFRGNLELLYSGDSEYYIIRRAVLDALFYWRDRLKPPTFSVKTLLYNKAVDEDKQLSKEMLLVMIEDIQSLFPVRHYKAIYDTYSAVLRKLSAPFDAYADYSSVAVNGNAYTYLTIMRIMRNWFAHSLFANVNPTEKEFLFLFLIALRALFDRTDCATESNQYEQNILELLRTRLNHINDKADMVFDEEAKKIVYGFYNDTYSSIAQNNHSLSSNYGKMVESLGKKPCDKTKCTFSKLLDIVWTSKYPVVFKFFPKPQLNNKGNISLNCNFESFSLGSDLLSDIIRWDYYSR